jgi:hypothetical protein
LALEKGDLNMTPSEIKPGMRFGNWEVIEFSHVNKHRIKYFTCKCLVCGTIRAVRGTALIQGTSTACSRACQNSLIGQTFGEWTVITQDKSRPRYWICKCSCGTVKSVFDGSLKQGTSKSCGCKKSIDTKKRHAENAESHIGEKHGKLTLLSCYAKNDAYWYHCMCDCGNEVDVLGKRIFSGTTASCGCIDSKANAEMDKVLTRLNIPFKREYRFESCSDKKPLPFDFALFNNEDELIGLIELNGSLHYSTTGTSWDTPERLVYQQKHDYIKRKFCEDNKIPFLVIPYQFFNELEKFLVTSDFWQIVTKNFND